MELLADTINSISFYDIKEFLKTVWIYTSLIFLFGGLFLKDGPGRYVFWDGYPLELRFKIFFMIMAWPILLLLAVLYKIGAVVEQRKNTKIYIRAVEENSKREQKNPPA